MVRGVDEERGRVTPVPPLTVAETASALGVSGRHVLTLVRAGRLPGAFDVASPGSRRRSLRIPAAAVEAMKASAAVGARVARPRRKLATAGVKKFF